MQDKAQDVVCAFVRRILEARTRESIEITERPELHNRNSPTVDELWSSRSYRYAVEHTRLESYSGQLANEARIQRLVMPVRSSLLHTLPGSHVITVRASEMQMARIRYADAHKEIVRLALEMAPTLQDGETRALPSEILPFSVLLHRRRGAGSHVAVHCRLDGDGEKLRTERMRRALSDKCPKLARWSADGRTSILVLEANDSQLSNQDVAYQAFRQTVGERSDQPDVVVFVETDAGPMYGWMFKEGQLFGDDVPMPTSDRCYVEGDV